MRNENQKDFTVRNILGSFLPLVVAIFSQYIVSFVDVIALFVHNIRSEEKSESATTIEMIMNQDYNQPMNLAYMTLAQHLLYLLCFGLWYYKVFYTAKDESAKGPVPFKRILFSVGTVLLAIAGFSSQVMVDGILTFIRPLFEQAFTDYDKLVAKVVGIYSSPVMIIAVVAVAPIAEELLFRGVIQGYARRYMPLPLAILFQGALFGVYHGNTIQGIYAFVLGCLIGWIAYRAESVIPGIIFHLVLNASLLIVPGGWFASTGACLIATLAGLIVAALSLFMWQRKIKP